MITEATATLLAATLAAFVALITIVITKEQKVSEFRQAWINDFRADLAEAMSAASTLTVILQLLHESKKDEEMHREWARFIAALSRLELRLNLKEALHRELEQCIRSAEMLVRRLEANPEDYAPSQWTDLSAKVITVAHPLLKDEWDRVKDGEPFYRATKALLIAVVVLVPLGVAASYVRP